MIKNYNSFLNEANVKNKIDRKDLKIGDDVMTHGEYDGVNIDYQVGKILKMEAENNGTEQKECKDTSNEDQHPG